MTSYQEFVVRVDARSRAWRTLVTGLGVDVVAAVVVVLLANVGVIEWTANYWLGLASLAGKSAIMAVLSYAARRLIPPSLVGVNRDRPRVE